MKTERNIWWLIAAVCGISGIGWLTNTYPPQGIVLISIFFFLVFFSFFCFGIFITNRIRFGIILAIGSIGFFLLRFLGLREVWYSLLLLASLLSLELYLRKQ